MAAPCHQARAPGSYKIRKIKHQRSGRHGKSGQICVQQGLPLQRGRYRDDTWELLVLLGVQGPKDPAQGLSIHRETLLGRSLEGGLHSPSRYLPGGFVPDSPGLGFPFLQSPDSGFSSSPIPGCRQPAEYAMFSSSPLAPHSSGLSAFQWTPEGPALTGARGRGSALAPHPLGPRFGFPDQRTLSPFGCLGLITRDPASTALTCGPWASLPAPGEADAFRFLLTAFRAIVGSAAAAPQPHGAGEASRSRTAGHILGPGTAHLSVPGPENGPDPGRQ